MFRSSIDAFLYLLDGREQRDHANIHRISSMQVEMSRLGNGIKRCGVQVLFTDGAGYRIEAYDEEADELYGEAKKYSQAIEELPLAIGS